MEGLAIDESFNQQKEEEAESDDEFCILDHPDREPEVQYSCYDVIYSRITAI